MSNKLFGGACLIQAVALVLAVLAAGWSVDYISVFHGLKDVPFILDALIGLFTGGLSVPYALILIVFF